MTEKQAQFYSHVFWSAADPDCPAELKAKNGELHTLRCKRCGSAGKGSCVEEGAVDLVTDEDKLAKLFNKINYDEVLERRAAMLSFGGAGEALKLTHAVGQSALETNVAAREYQTAHLAILRDWLEVNRAGAAAATREADAFERIATALEALAANSSAVEA